MVKSFDNWKHVVIANDYRRANNAMHDIPVSTTIQHLFKILKWIFSFCFHCNVNCDRFNGPLKRPFLSYCLTWWFSWFFFSISIPSFDCCQCAMLPVGFLNLFTHRSKLMWFFKVFKIRKIKKNETKINLLHTVTDLPLSIFNFKKKNWRFLRFFGRIECLYKNSC